MITTKENLDDGVFIGDILDNRMAGLPGRRCFVCGRLMTEESDAVIEIRSDGEPFVVPPGTGLPTLVGANCARRVRKYVQKIRAAMESA